MADPGVPTVQMLWEVHDPKRALADRFGFEDVGSAVDWVTSVLAEHWGVQVASCERIVISDVNALAWITTPAGGLVAKWTAAPERFQRLSGVAHLTQWLQARGLPVSAPVPSSDGRRQVEIDGASIGLQRVVDGDLLDVADPHRVHAAGAVLAQLHRALADYPDAKRVAVAAGAPPPLATRIASWADSPGEHVPNTVRDLVRSLVADAPADPPAAQLVHGDFRSSNVLCADGEVAAVIDLEEVRLDHCVVELARSAVMLGTQFRNWGPVSSEVRATFLEGYESVRRLTPVEASWRDLLILWQAWALVPPDDDPTGWRASALDQAALFPAHHVALAPQAGQNTACASSSTTRRCSSRITSSTSPPSADSVATDESRPPGRSGAP